MSEEEGNVVVLSATGDGDYPSSPPASYESPCSSDTSTKNGIKSNDPPDTSGGKKTGGGDVIEPPTDPPLIPTIGVGGGSGTPSMVTCPSISLSSTPPTSATATDGTITPSVSGGSGDYDISISSGTPLADGKFSGLGQGSFDVTVTDKQYSCQDVKASADLVIPSPPDIDPCGKAKLMTDNATTFSKSNSFTDVKQAISNAATDGNEHSITFGKDAIGNITISSMNNGTPLGVKGNSSFPGAFADMHNHPDDTPQSPGDLYGLLGINSLHSQYLTKYVLTQNGIVYALAITNSSLASTFFSTYHFPTGNQNAFPDPLFDEWSDIFNVWGSTQEIAMAFILDKYNSGVALLKQDSAGNFHKLGATVSTDSKGNKTYTSHNCPN